MVKIKNDNFKIINENITKGGIETNALDKKFLLYLLFVFVLILLILPHALAVGITPGRTQFDFSPGKVVDGGFEVVNSGEDGEFVVLVQGELNQSVSVSQVSFKMSALEGSKKLSYKVAMPQKLSPGLHTAEVVVLQLPKASGDGTFVGSTVGVVTQIYVNVPYPGKYLETSLNIGVDGDKGIKFFVPLVSRGKLDVVRAKAIIDIYSSLNEKITTVNTNELPVKSLDRGELVASLDSGKLNPGRYRAVATIVYDEETSTVEKEFSIGDQVLKIKNVEVNDFTLGQIAKFEFLVENTWSEPIKGAYLQMQIYNTQKETMADFKSQTYDINPLESKLMTAFWDTDGVQKGNYDSSVFLKFGEQSLRQDLKLEVSSNEINVVGVGYVISNGGGGGSNTMIIVLSTIVGLLVVINLLWFLVLRKRLKKK